MHRSRSSGMPARSELAKNADVWPDLRKHRGQDGSFQQAEGMVSDNRHGPFPRQAFEFDIVHAVRDAEQVQHATHCAAVMARAASGLVNLLQAIQGKYFLQSGLQRVQ